MADYKGSTHDGVYRTLDDLFIARNVNNPDWQDFLTWQNAGGVLDPADDFVPPVYTWYLDIGPFFDRFGASKMAVLTSTHVVAKAVVTDVMVRKWIDLQNQSVADGIDALIAIGIAGIDSTLKNTILTTPVADEENSALRKLYFS